MTLNMTMTMARTMMTEHMGASEIANFGAPGGHKVHRGLPRPLPLGRAPWPGRSGPPPRAVAGSSCEHFFV